MFNINAIEELRKFHGTEGEVRDANYEDICYIIEAYKPEGYTVEEAHNDFEEGGRWSNYKTDVYKVECNGEVAYFELWEEVPATEMQEGGFFSYGFHEVVPKEIVVIKYISKKEAVTSA